YRDAHQHAKAEDFLRRSIFHSQRHESQLRKAYAYLVDCCQAQGKDQDAWQACEEGVRLFPEDTELRFMKAGLLHRRGRTQEATQVYASLLQANGKEYLSSCNRGITGFVARQNMAVAYADAGDLARAEEQWRLVVQEMPRYKPGWQGLADALLRQQKLQELPSIVKTLLAEATLRSLGVVLEARLSEAQGDCQGARSKFEQAVTEFANDPDVLESQCRFLFERGQPEEAERALRALLLLNPRNPSALHNLGTVLQRLGKLAEAIETLQQSLLYRPESSATALQLGYALLEAGRLHEAKLAFQQAHRQAPPELEPSETLPQMKTVGHEGAVQGQRQR